MKKLFLLLFVVTSFLQAQTYPNPTFGTVTTKTSPTVTDDPYVTTTGTTGVQGKIAPVNLLIPHTPVNYSVPNLTIGAHLGGIDTRLGQISSTTAGITQRVYFTADNTTVNGFDYFASSLSGKGIIASGSPSALVLPDNTKGFFNKDLISIAQPSPTIGYAGTYSGNLTVSATPTPVATQQRFTVEIYRTDNLGTPIASGVSGAPVGDLGVTVLAILDSGIINLSAGSITNVPVSGILTQNVTINTGERLRYHVSAAKIGTGGGNVTFGVYYGNAYNSYYDVPVAIRSNAVLDDSDVPGAVTVTDALNALNANKANDSNTVHKTGDTFTESLGFPPLLSYNTDTSIGKRILEPESTHGTATIAPIYAWGDSLTAGAGGTPYPTTLQGLIFSTVTNKGIGGETSTQIKDRLVADAANYSKSVIIWAGRNNYTDPTTVKADIATMISTLGHTRYLVVGIINGNYTYEYKDQPGWTTIQQLNADLKALYGNKFIDIRPYLVSLHDNSAQDLIDFGRDIVPTSLRSDALHLNTSGYNKVAEYINQRLGYLYNLTGYLSFKDFNYYNSIFGILNQGSISQSANFNISGAGIINRIISRAGTSSSAGTALHHVFQSAGGSNRFAMGQTTVEGGSNSGSNFNIVSFDDSGAVLGIPFTIFRADGNVVIRGNGVVLATNNGYKLDVEGSFRSASIFQTNIPSTATSNYDIVVRENLAGADYGKYKIIPSSTFSPTASPTFTGTVNLPNTNLSGYLDIGAYGAINFSASGSGFGSVASIQKTSAGLGFKSTAAGGSYLNLITDDLTTVRDVRAADASGTMVVCLNGSATLDFPSTAAGTSSVLTFTVTGAVDGDVISLGIPNASSNANSCFTTRVSAANTIEVKFNNYSSGSIDPSSGTFKVKVFK